MINRLKNKLGVTAVIILSFLPVVFWVIIRPIDERFFGLAGWLTSLGQLSGLIGLAMLSLSVIMSARLKFMEDYFGGMDRVYKVHHIISVFGFILILFHPLVLAAKYLTFSVKGAALFLLPGGYWPQNAGIMALLGLIIFLALSFFFENISYELRKLSHKFLGWAYLLALLHSFFASSDISRDLPLRVYMLALAVLALAGFIYRSVLGRWLVKKSDYQLEAVRTLPGKIIELEMRPWAEPLKFQAGQFVFISIIQPGLPLEAHPFTIASAPDNKNLIIDIKSLGDYTLILDRLRPGVNIKVEGPFGRFFSGAQGREQIWIAAGIGITPFLSQARSLKDNSPEIDFYYLAKNKSEAVFLKELKQIAKRRPNLNLIPYFSEEQAERLSAQIILETSQGLKGKDIFFCGPPPMLKSLKKQFKQLKVRGRFIRSEEFQLL